ncbi:MAG: hypothetical protein AAF348_19655 [Bacteroidota bacterium]
MEEIITKKKVIETIGFELETTLKPYRFKFVKTKDSLIRKHKDGFDKILFYATSGYPYSHQELGVQFMVRLNDVENVVGKFYDDRFRNMEYAKDYYSIGVDYRELKEKNDISFEVKGSSSCNLCKRIDRDIEFIIHNEDDLKRLSIYLGNFIESKALDFFEKSKDIAWLNDHYKNLLLNSEHPIDLFSVMNSLVLMKLCNDPKVSKLSKDYTKSMVPAIGFEHSSYEALDEIKQYLGITTNMVNPNRG